MTGDDGSASPNLVIRGNGTHRYMYVKFMVGAGCVLSLIVVPIAAARGTDDWLLMLGAPLVMGLEALGFCWFWIRRELQVSYIVEGGRLAALRGKKVVKSVPITDIRDVRFWGRMNFRSFFTRYLPAWPALEVTYQHGDKQVMRTFPSIMLWDTEQDAAEESLRRQLDLR